MSDNQENVIEGLKSILVAFVNFTIYIILALPITYLSKIIFQKKFITDDFYFITGVGFFALLLSLNTRSIKMAGCIISILLIIFSSEHRLSAFIFLNTFIFGGIIMIYFANLIFKKQSSQSGNCNDIKAGSDITKEDD